MSDTSKALRSVAPRLPSRARRWAGAFTLASAATTSLVSAEPSSLPPGVGYNAGEMETPRSAALGGATRAMSSSIEALYANPAGMATARIYHVGGIAQIWPQARRQTYGAAAVDSIVNKQRIAGGVAANWTSQDPDGVKRDSFDFRFALAAPLSDRFFLGGTLRYLSLSEDGFPGTDGLTPSVASQGLDDGDIVADLTFDAGVTLQISRELALSAVGTNLTNPGHGFLPLTFGGGAGFGSEEFTLELDVVGDFTTYDDTALRVMAGGEVLLADSFPIRAGYRFDEGLDTHSVGGGLGFVSPDFAVDASVRGVVAGAKSWTIVIGFRYHVESGGLSGGF